MSQDDTIVRRAVPADAPAIASLVNMASEGIAHYVWDLMAAPGQGPWEVGKEQVLSDSPPFTHRNALVVAADEDVVACMISFPTKSESHDTEALPPIVVPLLELEAEATGSWFVNFLAVIPSHRGRGLGERLLAVADENARREKLRGCSLVVSDTNSGALRLYRRCGYREEARREMIKQDWPGEGREWLLMHKPLS